MQKVRWGIMGTAKIAREKLIPAMKAGNACEVVAIASRNAQHAQHIANELGITKAYGSYEELLESPDVDAVYIPLPNHLHVEWALKAIAAGKHVLCEKPIALSAPAAENLRGVAEANPNVKVMEAFMYRFHPQWQSAKKLVDAGRIGTLKTIQSFFSYFNDDPQNIRNQVDAGGGGLMDIGCYPVSLSRFIFGAEPTRVFAAFENDPVMQTDRLTSGILQFKTGTSTFTCSTQLAPFQQVNILGTEGRIEILIPFNAPSDQPTRIWVHTPSGSEKVDFAPIDQYTLQADAFSRAILNNSAVPTPLSDAVNNMLVIDGLFKSAKSNTWQGLTEF